MKHKNHEDSDLQCNFSHFRNYKKVIGPLAPYLYRYWHHSSRLLLVIERKKNINIAQATPDRKKNKIMAYLTHSVSRNDASVLSKIADKNLPILSNFIRHVRRFYHKIFFMILMLKALDPFYFRKGVLLLLLITPG